MTLATLIDRLTALRENGAFPPEVMQSATVKLQCTLANHPEWPDPNGFEVTTNEAGQVILTIYGNIGA